MKALFFSSFAACCILIFTSANSQSVSLSKNIYAPGEKITVSYSGFQGSSRDWISIAQPGSADDKYLYWQYTGGATSGTLTFDGIAYGDYEIRGYFNNEGIIRARMPFKVGNADINLSAKTLQPSYKPYEKIMVQFSGMPGNSKDWISLATAGSSDDKYVLWFYTDSKQSGTLEFQGVAEGNYEVRTYFNGEWTVRSRYPFTVSKSGGTGAKICRTELSTFYAGMNSLGLCWGRLGSDAFVPEMITAVQTTLPNVIAALNVIPCLDFDANKIRNFSSRLQSLSRQQAVNEIDQLIREIQAALQRANITCDKGGNLEALFTGGVHLGAAQAIANTFICRMISPEWQSNISTLR